MEEIIVLEIKYQYYGLEDIIYPVILKDDQSMVLVDCGLPGFLPLLERAVAEKGFDLSQLTHVVITHQDHDHMGALHCLKTKYPQIIVAAGAKEVPYVSGARKSLRLEQAEALQQTLPEGQKQFGIEFCNYLRNVQPVKVDMALQDGDETGWCGGCQIIGTPGHTPGHISLYIHRHKTLITGDAAILENGSLGVANPQFTLDMIQAEESLYKIQNLGADRMICYHGGVMTV